KCSLAGKNPFQPNTSRGWVGVSLAGWHGRHCDPAGQWPHPFGTNATDANASSCRDRPQLGLVSSLRHWAGGAGNYRDLSLGGCYRGLDAVLWMATADRGGNRDRPDGHGWTMGRCVPTLGGCHSVWGGRLSDDFKASGHCRDSDLADGRVLSGVRNLSNRGSCGHIGAGLGLACAQWLYRAAVGYPRAGAMAGDGPVGDRHVRRDRAAILW